VHPAKLAKEDAEVLRGPHLVLASNGENPEDVKAFDETQKPTGSETHTYSNMHHGWMGARAKLNEEENLKEYKRGLVKCNVLQVTTRYSHYLRYEQLSAWFNKVLA
jgi:hypothetical protein